MTSLIKSTHFSEEPLVLTHVKKWEAAMVAPSPSRTEDERPSEESTVPEVDDNGSFEDAVSETESSPQESYLSYEEYKSRFDAELGTLAEEAKQEGFERGQAEGMEQAKAEYAAQIEALTQLIVSMRAALDKTIDGVSEIGIEVVCEAVTKIIGEALLEKEVIVSAVRQVIRRAKERAKLVVRVSPADWSILEGHEAELIEGFSVGSVEIVADDRVQVGGCLLETPAGTLDGRLEVQLERLREAMVNARPTTRETEAA